MLPEHLVEIETSMSVEPIVEQEGTSVLEFAAEHVPIETERIARAASIISLGNVASRVLGLAREFLKSHYFGAGSAVAAYEVATIVPNMLYDLLIGGMVNSSLVPVFSEYAAREREELWRMVSALLSLTALVMALFILIVEVFAPTITFMLSRDLSPDAHQTAARLLQITIPAVMFLSLSGVLSGLLYALKRFAFPAFTAAVFNGSIVLGTLLLHKQLGVASMAVGLIIGALGQVVLQIPGLKDAKIIFTLSLRHVGLRRVALLYMPIALGLMVDVLISRPFSYNIASQTAGDGGIPWMRYATYLIQLPQGLVATAVSFAVLPTLSAHAAGERTDADRESFLATLAQGLRLVAVLILPATIGLFILARPIVSLLFQHGAFTPFDTQMTSQALQYYLLGLPFAAFDLLLVFAFYARQDTLTPSLIGVATVLLYIASVILLVPTLGLFSLMFSESLKLLLHTAISAFILRRRLGGLARHGVMRTIGLSMIASAVMGIAAYGALLGVDRIFPAGLVHEVLSVLLPGVLGAGTYIGLISLFRVSEMHLVISALRRRLGGEQKA